MNIHRTLLGVFNGIPYLGSLDFLSGQARLAAWPSATQQVESILHLLPTLITEPVVFHIVTTSVQKFLRSRGCISWCHGWAFT